MTDYRTPDEHAQQDAERYRVRRVVAAARRAATSLFVAMRLDEPEETIALWTDRVWDGLRDNMSDEDRLLAIIMLIEGEADSAAQRELRALDNWPGPPA